MPHNDAISKWCSDCNSGPFEHHYLYCPFDKTELKSKCDHGPINDNGCCVQCGEDIKPECISQQ